MPVATDPPTASPADDTGDDPPDASLELDPAAVRVQRDRLAHALHFADLTEVQFDLVRTFAFERQFDLLSRHLWATTRHDAAIGGPKLFIGLTIEGFRAVAHRTGQYAGCDRNEYQYAGTAGQAGETGNAAGPDRDAWDDDDATKNVPAHPVRAIATVYRRIDGHREQFVGEAVWRDLYTAPAGGDVLSYRDQAPETWLGKCAKAAALREAFPNELGGIYTPEEMARTLLQMSRPGRRGGGVEDAGRTTQPPSHANTSLPATACDESVCSQRSFELALIDEGAKGEADRRRILKLARQRLPDLARLRDPAAFYGHAIADVRNNPQAYSLPAAVMA